MRHERETGLLRVTALPRETEVLRVTALPRETEVRRETALRRVQRDGRPVTRRVRPQPENAPGAGLQTHLPRVWPRRRDD